MLFKGQDVGYDLDGVVFVRETVNDWDLTVIGHIKQTILTEGAHHDEVTHAANDTCRIWDRFRATDL